MSQCKERDPRSNWGGTDGSLVPEERFWGGGDCGESNGEGGPAPRVERK